MFFRLTSLELGLLIFGIVLGTTLLGVAAGRRLHPHADALREPFGVLQAALLGLVGLILAFGLTLAVGRYDARRAAVVETANAIGTTYLRAQTLREPTRRRSLEDLVRYTDATIRLSESALDRVKVADDDGQQIVEVVGNAAGQLAHCFHFLRLGELLLGMSQFLLSGATPGDVTSDFREPNEVALAISNGVYDDDCPERAAIFAHAPRFGFEAALFGCRGERP